MRNQKSRHDRPTAMQHYCRSLAMKSASPFTAVFLVSMLLACCERPKDRFKELENENEMLRAQVEDLSTKLKEEVQQSTEHLQTVGQLSNRLAEVLQEGIENQKRVAALENALRVEREISTDYEAVLDDFRKLHSPVAKDFDFAGKKVRGGSAKTSKWTGEGQPPGMQKLK